MILHANELGPPILLRHKLHLRKLHRPHTTRTNIPDLPALDQIMQSLHCLLDRRVLIESVDLQQVDVVRFQARERFIDGVEDCSA